MTPPSTKRLKLSLRGCPAWLPEELRSVYREVWQSLCALSAKTHVRFDLEAGRVRQRGLSGRWKPLASPVEGERLLQVMQTVVTLPRRAVAPKASSATIVVAGGAGTRFGEGESRKVLHPVKGVPAIDRLIRRCHDAACDEIVVVVGYQWDRVVKHLEARYEGIHYVYQHAPQGTGDAARLGARYLAAQGFGGDVLVLAGDKVLSETAIGQILQTHRGRKADMTLAAASKSAWPGSGRVVLDGDSRVLAILEQPDVARDQILSLLDNWQHEILEPSQFLTAAGEVQPNAKKLRKGLGEAASGLLDRGESLATAALMECLKEIPRGFVLRHLDGREERLRGHEVEERCQWVNVSLYAFRSAPLFTALEKIQPANAQGEFYLTDAAQLMTSGGLDGGQVVVACMLPNDFDAAGFNTVEELTEIEARIEDA